MSLYKSSKNRRLKSIFKQLGLTFVVALLVTLATPAKVYADMHELHFYAHPQYSANISPITGYVNVSSETGAQTSFSAAPYEGYTFYRWVGKWPGQDDRWSNSQSTVMACSGLTEAHAYMVKNSDAGIVVSSADDTKGTVIGTRPWSWSASGQYFTISATPKDPTKYEFDHWEKNGKAVGLGASAEVPMPSLVYDFDNEKAKPESQVKYVAFFKNKENSDHGFRAVTGSEGGSITSGGFLAYDHWQGATASATATPSQGYEFVQWNGPDGKKYSDQPTLSVGYPPGLTEDDKKNDIVYTAIFKVKDSKGITTEARKGSESGDIGGGTVSPSYIEWSENNKNQSISVTASPDKGMAFDHWEDPNSLIPSASTTNPTISVKMPESKPTDNLKLIAIFKTDDKFEVYTEVALDKNGNIYQGQGGAVNPTMVKLDPSNPAEVTLVAEPHDGYEFDRWEMLDNGGGTEISFNSDITKPKISLKVPQDGELTRDAYIRAVFRPALDDGIWGLALDGGEVSPRYIQWSEQTRGSSFNMTASPDPGYKFDHWKYHNQNTGLKIENYSINPNISVRMPEEQITEDITYTAVFKKINEKTKNKEIHVTGKKTGITDESFLNKWRTWIDPALKYVRSTIQSMASTRTAKDAAVYESNKPNGNASSQAAADLKADIKGDDKLKHSQSLDNPIIANVDGFSVTEISGFHAVFTEGDGGKSESEAKVAVTDKYGSLYKSEVVIAGDIFFENEKGERVTSDLTAKDNDVTVVMSGINTDDTDMWMLLYTDSASNEFTITPVTDSASVIRFTLPDNSGGKITLISVKYN